MPLATFEGANQTEAMKAMADAMGPDALVVSCQEIGGRVRLTAAPASSQEMEDLSQFLAPAQTEKNYAAIKRSLQFHRVIDQVSQKLLAEASEEDDFAESHSDQARLARRLAKTLQFGRMPWADQSLGGNDRANRPIMFVGPPGGGKTAVCARLALASLLAGKKPAIGSLDQDKTGGTVRLEKLLQAMKLSLSNPPAPARENTPAFIDHSGTNPFSDKEMAGLAQTIAGTGSDPVLVFDAAGDAADAQEIAKFFQAIGVQMAIASKLDLCHRLGSLLSVATSGIALCGATVSPMIAKPVLPLTAAGLARLMMRQQFHHLKR